MSSPNDLPEGVKWKQSFQDGFVGTALDTKKWNPSRYHQGANEAPYNADKEAAVYTTSGVSISGGQAKMTLKSVDPWIGVNGQYFGYTSGVMTTRDKASFGPGDFVQARLFVPKGDGLWPAFWSTSVDGSWGPEFDFFEFFDTGKDTRPYFSVLSEKNVWNGPTAYGDPATDYRGSWHVYGVWWKKDGTLVPYIDGVARPEVAKQTDTVKRQFLILNLALQKGYTPPANAQFKADWVRFYTPTS